ncbi:MFS transporter [Acidimangrovimonas sediminis]|uniref:MFS transporter n=1 Tax=Acidimangrovimonas sediminis TaxID=2056283 RepID=UPI000C80B4C7|nr:MFS transporter [Acidimangrovimonas sediminis]
MIRVLGSTWPLLMGVMLLMVGNGVQGTLLGIRGGIEGFSTFQMSVVMSAYFLGFLFGSRVTPGMIRRVGHVRVFAALGSLISAVLVLYPVLAQWQSWALLRILIGFCFSGVYITAESWLNNTATNETRGQALSLYMIVQMIGIVAAQALMNVASPSGFTLFVIPSVLVSLAFTPILLSIAPAPVFDTTKPLSFRKLYQTSPLGCIGVFLMGGVFSALFGMASVWGTQQGLSVRDISIFIGTIYVGGMLFQYPIGWASDRMDRRMLILGLTAFGGAVAVIAAFLALPFVALLGVALVVGGISNPLYSLLIAYTNDFLDKEDMAAASAGLIFINGTGAILGPVITGWIMAKIGAGGFFLFIGILLAMLSAYAGWRMTRRRATPVSETGAFAAVVPTASTLAVEAVFEAAVEDSTDAPGDPANEEAEPPSSAA